MENQLTDLTFEEWVEFAFARPREKDAGKRDYWQGPLPVTLAYLTRAFENADTVLGPISDKQLAEALWNVGIQLFTLHDSPSHKYCKTDLPGADRARAIRSVLTLFQQIFAKRCPDHLCHLNYSEAGQYTEDTMPLNGICYMWWDGNCQSGASEDDPCRDEIDTAILDVLEGTLALDSIACQESALHGLSDAIVWQICTACDDKGSVDWEDDPSKRPDAAQRARAIIDAYLARSPGLMPELVEYALAAREGGGL